MKRFLPIAAVATASLAAPAAMYREPPRSAPVPLASAPAPAPVTPAPSPVALLPPAPPPVPEPEPNPQVPPIEGQGAADYQAWLARDPGARAEVGGFESFLRGQGLHGVLPTWQLTRTASDYAKCAGPAFEVAPIEEWRHIAATLRFIKMHVEPVIGEVEARSGYRNAELNACAGGARESAHRRFFALDLVPTRDIARAGLIRSLCAIHGFRGAGYDIGLGFYNGLRFHIDSKGFRKWGPNGKGETSPCVTGV